MATVFDALPPPTKKAAIVPERFLTLEEAGGLAFWERIWNLLDEQAANPMQSFAWIDAAAATIGQGGKLRFVGFQRGERLAAVAPLVKLPGAVGGPWELLNLARLYEPADLLAVDETSLLALSEELARRGLPLFLGRLPAESPTIAAIRQAYGRRGWVVCRPQANTPYIPLDESWATPESKLSSRRRSDFRRSRRHAEELGDVSTEIVNPDARDVDHLLDVAFEIESRSWKGERGTALAHDPVRGGFYRRYARSAAGQGMLRVGLLHIGGRAAAMQLSVVQARALWVLKVGYDPQFQRASPGILLMVEQIKRAVAEGLHTYELLGTVEPWIQVWTDRERDCVSLRAYPANLRGLAALATDAGRKCVARLTERGKCKA